MTSLRTRGFTGKLRVWLLAWTAAVVPGAAGAVDISGHWPTVQVVVPAPTAAPPLVFFFAWDITQTPDGSLTVVQAGPNCGDGIPCDTLTGTIDAATGQFVLSATNPSNPFCPSYSAAGSVGALGNTFSGTYQCTGGLGGFDHGTFDGSGRCNNGTLDPGEQCDVADASPADCCSDECRFEPTTTFCTGDANSCTVESCDAAGACVPSGILFDGAPCNDGNSCTELDSCQSGACTSGPPAPAGGYCDSDDNACTIDACDGAGSCTAGACSPCCDEGAGCVPAPATGCIRPTSPRATVLARHSPATGKGSLAWKIPNGAATTAGDFGDPTSTSAYTLCLYGGPQQLGGDPQLIASSLLPPGGTCDGKPCWKATPKTFTYRDRAGTQEGITGVTVKYGADGKTLVAVSGKGQSIFRSGNGFWFAREPVIAQLRVDGGACFEAKFEASQLLSLSSQLLKGRRGD